MVMVMLVLVFEGSTSRALLHPSVLALKPNPDLVCSADVRSAMPAVPPHPPPPPLYRLPTRRVACVHSSHASLLSKLASSSPFSPPPRPPGAWRNHQQ